MRKYNFEEITLDMNTGPVEQAVRAVQGAVGGLSSVIRTLEKDMQAAFSQKKTVSLSKELLVLRLAWGKLGAAIRRAVEPVAAVVVPVITQAVYAATRLVKRLGQIIGALFGVAEGTQSASDGMESIETAAKSSAKAVRSLAGFDQLERIDTGGDSERVSVSVETDTLTLSTAPLLLALSKLHTLLEPILTLDFSPLLESLRSVVAALGGFAEVAGSQLKWLFEQVLLPNFAWVVEELAPQVLGTLATALDTVTKLLEPLQLGIQSLYQQLQPVMAFLKETVLTVLAAWQERFAALGAVFEEKGPKIQGILQNIGQVLGAVWAVAEPILVQLRQCWAETFGFMSQVLAGAVSGLIDGLYGVTEFLAGIFTGDWERAWGGIGQVVKTAANGIIGFINFMLDGVVMGINRVIQSINKISFTVPDWVPLVGGEKVGFHIGTLKAPQIPYLAKGAVLPANRPFLAMVGDQHHGTNVEAPLATIQEAVANVMQDQTGAMMAGFEASVQVQRQILEAVLGIRIGDAVIANACDRYHRKMAVVKGG